MLILRKLISPLLLLVLMLAAISAIMVFSILFQPPQGTTSAPPFTPLDLTHLTWAARLGFDPADRAGFGAPAETAGAADDVVAVREFPVRLNELFSIPPGESLNQFTLVTTFDMTATDVIQPLMIGLAEIGENWAIYINGTEVRSEIYLNASGQIARHRSLQNVMIPLSMGLLKPGRNTLVLRIAGYASPSSLHTNYMPGLPLATGYEIDLVDRLIARHSVKSAIAWAQLGIYLFFAFYQMLLFARRRETFSLHFAIFLITFAAYAFFSSPVAYENLPDTSLIIRLLYASLSGSIAMYISSLWGFLTGDQKYNRWVEWIVAFYLAGAVLLMLAPGVWLETILALWLMLVPVAVAYMIYVNLHWARQGHPDARRMLYGNLSITPLVAMSLLDTFLFRTGVDWMAWVPMVLAASFSSIYADNFWNATRALAESNRQLALSRATLEDEVIKRTAELSAANMRLRDQLDRIHSLQATLKEQAERDPLTGLYNRRTLMETLETDFLLAKSIPQPVSLVMIDIDHFKQVNDTHGHRAGDHILQRVAEVLSEGTRRGDYVCRYGGEEFLVVLPGAGLDQALQRAEEWRVAIDQMAPLHGHAMHVTISCGVAEYPLHGQTPDDLLRAADHALYAAKNAGRNRVTTPEL